MAGKAFDIRLIPEFHGISSDHTVSEWLEQVELVCEMCGVDNVEVESTYWGVVKLFNTQNKLMDVHQSDISKILLSSISNLVSFIFIKSCHFTEAYLVPLHKTSHTSCILFFWFPRAGSRESTPSVSSS